MCWQGRKACSNPKVKLLWAESLANPGGVVSDIRALADITREAGISIDTQLSQNAYAYTGIPLIIDNTKAKNKNK